MKKLLTTLAAALALTGTFGVAAVAAQASNCSIQNTGPGSNNTCTVTNTTDVTVTCTNGVTVANGNVQTANSGQATVSGNTVSGTATSGDAENTNAVATDIASFCAAAPAAAVTPTPTPTPTTPVTGEGGRGAGAVAGAATKPAVAALPATGVNSVASVIAVAVAGTVALAGAARLAVALKAAFKNFVTLKRSFMANRHAKRALVRYYSSVIATYGVTLLFACYLFTPFGWFMPEPVYSQVAIEPAPVIPQTPIKPLQMGKPVRVVVASLAIDLPIEDGVYNPADQSWSLTEKKAHYALPSVLANDRQGNTLIYGHYNQYVFYMLKDIKPGAVAQVYTDNGYIFSYIFVASANVKPDNVSVFRYGGGPTLTLQTCSGRWYETRQLFSFILQKVER